MWYPELQWKYPQPLVSEKVCKPWRDTFSRCLLQYRQWMAHVAEIKVHKQIRFLLSCEAILEFLKQLRKLCGTPFGSSIKQVGTKSYCDLDMNFNKATFALPCYRSLGGSASKGKRKI